MDESLGYAWTIEAAILWHKAPDREIVSFVGGGRETKLQTIDSSTSPTLGALTCINLTRMDSGSMEVGSMAIPTRRCLMAKKLLSQQKYISLKNPAIATKQCRAGARQKGGTFTLKSDSPSFSSHGPAWAGQVTVRNQPLQKQLAKEQSRSIWGNCFFFGFLNPNPELLTCSNWSYNLKTRTQLCCPCHKSFQLTWVSNPYGYQLAFQPTIQNPETTKSSAHLSAQDSRCRVDRSVSGLVSLGIQIGVNQ